MAQEIQIYLLQIGLINIKHTDSYIRSNSYL